jgi:hypothetical protein
MADQLGDRYREQIVTLVEQNFDACAIAREM